MIKSDIHTFHIPVMGLGFTIDTPLKVARYGISSVISIMEDELIEQMRKFHCEQSGREYISIESWEEDHRARRITEYLNLIDALVKKQWDKLRAQPFTKGSDIVTYFELLPDESALKQLYSKMMNTEDAAAKASLQNELRKKIMPGSIDVNILSKADRPYYTADGEPLPKEYCNAMAALRGFANSTLNSCVVFSAGYNPRLYAYAEDFADFFPDIEGKMKKGIILKVSDYRSAMVQGKIFAKKGLWISEFRIESGLNCGGHAFATDGLLLGPVLEEFKINRLALTAEMFEMCNNALTAKGKIPFATKPETRITVQGGVGTANEHRFLLEHYGMDSVGWASPFLLVPEVTNVDNETLHALANAKPDDFYLSNASPLGVLYNNFKKTTSQKQRLMRIAKGRPGSPCYKAYLSTNTEFTDKPICTASREYQYKKIKQLQEQNLSPAEFEAAQNKVIEKECLCEGLGTPALLKNHITPLHELKASAICPGPNLAYFSGIFTLKQMVEHIYGKINISNILKRSNMFVNELNLYISYLKKKIEETIGNNNNPHKEILSFRTNLLQGVEYYENLVAFMKFETSAYKKEIKRELELMKASIIELQPTPTLADV